MCFPPKLLPQYFLLWPCVVLSGIDVLSVFVSLRSRRRLCSFACPFSSETSGVIVPNIYRRSDCLSVKLHLRSIHFTTFNPPQVSLLIRCGGFSTPWAQFDLKHRLSGVGWVHLCSHFYTTFLFTIPQYIHLGIGFGQGFSFLCSAKITRAFALVLQIARSTGPPS